MSRTPRQIATHLQLHGRVVELLDGAASEDEKDRLFAHLAECNECRREYAANRMIKSRLAQLPTPAVPCQLVEALTSLSSFGQGFGPGPR